MKRKNPFIDVYKAVNANSNTEKYERIKNGEVTLPRYIDVELTNCCNFRCCFCPTGTKSMNRTRGFMSDEVVSAIVENVIKYNIAGVRFIRWGEPTLHPKYVEIMKKIKSAGAKIHLNTNGSLITDEQISEMIDMNLDSIKFSFQGADEGTYNEMREGGDYYKLINTIKKFNEQRGDKAVPYIQITTTITGETIDQVNSFKNDVDGLCDYYNIGYTKLNHLNVDSMKIDDNEKRKIKELQLHEKFHHTYLKICSDAFDVLSINWNGDVTLCCSDYDNYMIVGNILDNDLKQIFNSKAADNYRAIIAKGEYGKIKCCSECWDIVPLQN